MRMDRYEDENKSNDESKTRLNKNQELYTDVYLNNMYVDIDKLTDVVRGEEETEEVRKVKEINLSQYSNYEDKEYDIVKLVNEAISNKEEIPKGSFDFNSNEEEIKNIVSSINEKVQEEEKMHEDDELMADLMATHENTDILPALEPLPDTTNVIDHLSAPITDTDILKLPEVKTEEVALDMLKDINDKDMEVDDSFTESDKGNYQKVIIILIILLIIGASIVILKLLDVF